ncbi:MAG TPA: MerR family transcriptional regulator [Candidatus Avipropionibacterium avicola]|uniref:MerR family transcriptional regulator n=1 Tax=Candidatus Avipropionibacterium avicola TaxID=2840701 RepID=A0A9D1GZ76_9ACTN|nr:MerR family transcriptional regulator [Candidatus Avipropionibacterium avicola]
MAESTSLRSIGQVLAVMKADFPDITISKIRFLESEGLITPHRAPSGYRRFSPEDERRLRYILQVQREHYLPLKVIREHLDLMDRGLEPPVLESVRPTVPETTVAEPEAPPRQENQVRLDRSDLLGQSGLSEAALVELEKYQIVLPNRGTRFYGRDALVVAKAAKQLAEYGLDARHLRAIKMAADREVGLVEQAIAPYVRRTGGNRAVATEVMNLVVGVHSALLRSAISR